MRANPYLRGVKRSRDGRGPANQRLASSSEVVSSSEVTNLVSSSEGREIALVRGSELARKA